MKIFLAFNFQLPNNRISTESNTGLTRQCRYNFSANVLQSVTETIY